MAMKRRRKSTSSKTQISGPSITDLPSAIVVEIVLKLPTKSIVMCKSVCKTWRSLISDPHFVGRHLAQAKTCTLIRNRHNSKFSRSLYLLEPEDICSLDSGYCQCRANSADKCNHFRFNKRVKSKLKIPLMNVQVMLDKANDNTDAMFCVKSKSKSKDLIAMKSSNAHKYCVTGSCNGLLCLSMINRDEVYSVVVCNPVTGEFIHLPESSSGGYANGGSYFALGFGPKHNQYKVIRLDWLNDKVAAIHTLGTDSWRNLDISAFKLDLMIHSPAYLDGSLHWIFGKDHMASFDLDEERFRVDSVPSPPHHREDIPDLAVAALGGRIYLYTIYASTRVYIWVMDHGDGISKTWTQLFSIDVSGFHCSQHHRYELICCLSNEAVVMFGGPRDEFIYFDQSEGPRFKQLKFRGIAADFQAISHIPSFVSLKDVVMQRNVEVLNVNSGCGKLKLSEEIYPLLLGGSRK